MNWSLNIKERNKVALAFCAIFLLILSINWLVSYHIERINTEFRSFYNDRLVPAVDISDILGKTYQNQLLLEAHILNKDPQKAIKIEEKISDNVSRINELLHKFEKTYLVDEENLYLMSYHKKLKKQRELEKVILDLSNKNLKEKANLLFFNENAVSFGEVEEQIHKLIYVQGTVGKEMLNTVNKRSSSITVLLQLSFVISFIIAIIIFILVNTSRMIYESKHRTISTYHLN